MDTDERYLARFMGRNASGEPVYVGVCGSDLTTDGRNIGRFAGRTNAGEAIYVVAGCTTEITNSDRYNARFAGRNASGEPVYVLACCGGTPECPCDDYDVEWYIMYCELAAGFATGGTAPTSQPTARLAADLGATRYWYYWDIDIPGALNDVLVEFSSLTFLDSPSIGVERYYAESAAINLSATLYIDDGASAAVPAPGPYVPYAVDIDIKFVIVVTDSCEADGTRDYAIYTYIKPTATNITFTPTSTGDSWQPTGYHPLYNTTPALADSVGCTFGDPEELTLPDYGFQSITVSAPWSFTGVIQYNVINSVSTKFLMSHDSLLACP